jgi:hypothetical protein
MMADRTVPFTPVPGSQGYVYVDGVYLNLSEWSPAGQAEIIDTTNFNSPTDDNGHIHEENIVGTIGHEFTIRGPRDQGASSWNPMAGDEGQCYLGYAQGFEFGFYFTVKSIGGGSNVKGRAEFECTVKSNGLVDFTR